MWTAVLSTLADHLVRRRNFIQTKTFGWIIASWDSYIMLCLCPYIICMYIISNRSMEPIYVDERTCFRLLSSITSNMHLYLLRFILVWLYSPLLVYCDLFTHIIQGYFTCTVAIMLSRYHLGNPEGFKLNWVLPTHGKTQKDTTKHKSRAYFLVSTISCLWWNRTRLILYLWFV